MSDKIEKLSELDLQFNAYAKSNYTYNDAELLASLWNIDIVDAKKTIGYKIINKLEYLLPEKIIGGSGKFDHEERKYDLPVVPMDQTERAELMYTLALTAIKQNDLSVGKALLSDAIETHPQYFEAAVRSLAALEG